MIDVFLISIHVSGDIIYFFIARIPSKHFIGYANQFLKSIVFIAIYLAFRRPINNLIGLPTLMITLMLVQILFEPPVLYWTARNRFEYKYKAVIIVTLSMAILNPALGICMIKLYLFENAAISRVFSIAFVSVVFGGLFGLIIARKGTRPFSTKYWKYALKLDLPLIPHYLSMTVLGSSDRIMINNLCGKSFTALYSVPYNASMVMQIVTSSINSSFIPWTYQNAPGRKTRPSFPRRGTRSAKKRSRSA